MKPGLLRLSTVGLLAVLLAGCSTSVAGTAVRQVGGSTSSPTTKSGSSTSGSSGAGSSPSTKSPSSSVPGSTGAPSSSGGSDAGDYPTAPLKYSGTASSQSGANLLEARRIGDVLLTPTLIDPTLSLNVSLSTLPLRNADALGVIFGDPVPTVADRSGMITGFSTSRRDKADNAVVVAALEFESPAAATAALPAMIAATQDKKTDTGQAVIPGFLEAGGWGGKVTGNEVYLQSFLAQGALLLYVYASGKTLNPAQLATLSAKMYAGEKGAMAAFVPTPKAQIASLPVDPEGVRGRTLPEPKADQTVYAGVYTVIGFLHFSNTPVSDRQLLTSAGVDLVTQGKGALYRAKDETGSSAIRDNFVQTTKQADPTWTVYQPPAEFPTTKCLQKALSSVYYCVGTHGRYAFELSAGSEEELQKSLKSQVAMLAGA